MGIIKNVMEITWTDLKQLDKQKTVLFITVAPIEEHSHHLPLGTDIYEGEYWRRDTIKNLSEKMLDFNYLYLPPFPIASAGATGFYGNLHFKQKTVRDVVYELLLNVVSWGIRNIVFIASHGYPTHLIAIEEACVKINKKYGLCAFSPMGALFSAKELSLDLSEPEKIKSMNNKYPNDFHAGWIETSSMLDIDSSLVKNIFLDLPDIKIEEKEMISAKKVLKRMGKLGHLGYPRVGTKEIGVLLNRNLSDLLAAAIVSFVERKDYKKYEHHFLYRMPFLRTNFRRNFILAVALVLLVSVAITLYKISS